MGSRDTTATSALGVKIASGELHSREMRAGTIERASRYPDDAAAPVGRAGAGRYPPPPDRTVRRINFFDPQKQRLPQAAAAFARFDENN
jgi:hypothetical protein